MIAVLGINLVDINLVIFRVKNNNDNNINNNNNIIIIIINLLIIKYKVMIII